jgi:hypothetical protein
MPNTGLLIYAFVFAVYGTIFGMYMLASLLGFTA